jgi:hypothetical protein
MQATGIADLLLAEMTRTPPAHGHSPRLHGVGAQEGARDGAQPGLTRIFYATGRFKPPV